jgi:hypothetical protein
MYRVFKLAVEQQIAGGSVVRIHGLVTKGNKLLLVTKYTEEGGKVAVSYIKFEQ